MEENMEMMEVKNNEVDVVTEDRTGMSNGMAMFIGGGIAAGLIVGGMKLKKAWDKRKSKKVNAEVVEDELDFPDCEDVE